MSWPQVVFGWPTIILALGAFALAFARERSKWGFAGVVLACPFLSYASLTPGGIWLSPGLLVALGTAAVLLRRGRPTWAAVCLVPYAAMVMMLAAAVTHQR
jgi:hypothetical protein